MRRALALLATVMWAQAVPALADTSAVVEQIATLIDNNYFDAAKASEIAAKLRDDVHRGRFATLDQSRDLAAALTTRLKPFDRHFNVTWAGAVASAESPISTEAALRRGNYGFRSVAMLPGAIGYIDLRTFVDFEFGKPNEPARRAADAALAMVTEADAVIIDLRSNGGGLPAMVGYLVSAFTPPEPDIYNVIHRRDALESERPRDRYPAPRLDVPLYVLISGRAASAAESTAYTLQAARRAIVVGETSGGAANPGGEFPAGEGFNVFISTGTPVNPLTHANWERVGVKPDVPVPADQALDRAEILALETVLARNPQSAEATDTRWVLEALQAKRKSIPGPPLQTYAGTYAEARVAIVDGRLSLRRGQHPALTMIRVHDDVFASEDEPFRRALFERNAAGQVTGFQWTRSSGPTSWYRRDR
jgi:hypothetical protein